MNTFISVYCDGGSRGNPGEAAFGFAVLDQEGKEIYSQGTRIGIATNNVAEYSAVVAALKWLRDNKIKTQTIKFYLDSALVANQMKGIFKIKNENLRSFVFTAKKLENDLGGNVEYYAIPREQNKRADKMVNLALDFLI